MKHVRHAVFFLDRHLERVMMVVLSSVLILCLTYSAFIRYFVTIPFFTSLTHKAEELAIFSFTWLLYWGACLATKENAHFRIHAHFSRLPERWRRWQYLPGDLLWLGFNAFVVWQGWILTQSAIDNPEYSLSLEIHMAIIYSVIPLTFLMTIVRMLQNYWRRVDTPSGEPSSVRGAH